MEREMEEEVTSSVWGRERSYRSFGEEKRGGKVISTQSDELVYALPGERVTHEQCVKREMDFTTFDL
ncbi:hypothetical protein U1Q18_026036 [Sarracenia purpurea var. burkii]